MNSAWIPRGHEVVLGPEKLDATRPFQNRVQVELGDKAVVYNGMEIAQIDEVLSSDWHPRGIRSVYREFHRELDSVCATPEFEPPEGVLVGVAEDVPWGAVRALAATMWAVGYREVEFVFAVPSAAEAPPTTSASEELARQPTAAQLGENWQEQRQERIFGECADELREAAEQVFAAIEPPLSAKAMEAMTRALADGYAEGLVACRCATEVDVIKEYLWVDYFGQAASGGRLAVGVPLSLSSLGEKLALPDDTLWKDAHRHVIAASRRGGAFRLVGADASEEKEAQARDERWMDGSPGVCQPRGVSDK